MLPVTFKADSNDFKALSATGPSTKQRPCCSESHSMMWDRPNVVNTLPCKKSEYIHVLNTSEQESRLKYSNIDPSSTLHVPDKKYVGSQSTYQSQTLNGPNYYFELNLYMMGKDVMERNTVKDHYDDDGYIAADTQKTKHQEGGMQTFRDGTFGDDDGYKEMEIQNKKLGPHLGKEVQRANVEKYSTISANNDGYEPIKIQRVEATELC